MLTYWLSHLASKATVIKFMLQTALVSIFIKTLNKNYCMFEFISSTSACNTCLKCYVHGCHKELTWIKVIRINVGINW